jgi:uncharacterized membrane protein
MSQAPDSIAEAKREYDRRKKFAEDLKGLGKTDYEEIFRIVKEHQLEYSENSNGIFFDISQISSEVFSAIEQVVLRHQAQKRLENERLQELNTLGTQA